ncbi:MAG: diaminopimelate decarboxylase [Bacteroidales bacterium]|nr:diaminopimelate decarboxylase [Bacteroidales bacterium]
MFDRNTIKYLSEIETPFYYYNTNLLHETLFAIQEAADLFGYHLHYAIKANANPRILQIISKHNLGADCVSGNEIKAAIENGFDSNKIVFAGVGKTDKEIEYAIKQNIFCFNCESIQELEVINSIAQKYNTKQRVALRINPDINANTHKHITTGLKTNKFGISFYDFKTIIKNINNYNNITINGLHFHIGSQITDLSVFAKLCEIVNETYSYAISNNLTINHINLGGGLGINYNKPENHIPSFQAYFKIFNTNLNIPDRVQIHFEPGRSIVGQCGCLITKVLYVKENDERKTIIVDAGLTELLRPALYQSFHKIINLRYSKNEENCRYDIAGPICETSDYFGKSVSLPETERGHFLAIYSVGAYGEVMSSQYNLRNPALKYFSDDLIEKDTQLENEAVSKICSFS